MTKKLTEYRLGNFLRGYFVGKFKDDAEAWSYLSNRFLLSYPSPSGRGVMMYRKETINGFEQFVQFKSGTTELNDLDEKKVLRKCKREPGILI